MSRKSKQHDKQFKLDALKYVREHPDHENDGDIPTRGSGNYSSDEQKEIARLKRELRDAQDALDVLKKAISILGKS